MYAFIPCNKPKYLNNIFVKALSPLMAVLAWKLLSYLKGESSFYSADDRCPHRTLTSQYDGTAGGNKLRLAGYLLKVFFSAHYRNSIA